MSEEANPLSLYKGLKSYSISAIISMLSVPILSERLYLIKMFNYKNAEKGFFCKM